MDRENMDADLAHRIMARARKALDGEAPEPEIRKRAAETSRYDDGESEQVTPERILDGSRKLLAINRGEASPDDRDSMAFKKVYTTGDLIGERIKVDAGKTARNLLRKLSRKRDLKNLPPSFLDSYAEGQLIGNPLSAPIEETNPMQILEQQYRITSMGPGGIGSESAITEEAQNVHPSEFGFIDPVAGPESGRAGIDVRATHNSRLGTDGRIYQKFYNPRLDQYEWLSPRDLKGKTVAFNQ